MLVFFHHKGHREAQRREIFFILKKSLLYLILSILIISANAQGTSEFHWSNLPEIPPAEGKTIQPGLAGPFIGVDNNALIIAGGANFPDGPAWEGGEKIYHKDIYILEKKANGELNWIVNVENQLSEEIAYGLSIPTEKGLFCFGGMNPEQVFNTAFILNWNAQSKELTQSNLPPLPHPVANFNGGKIGSSIFITASDEQTGDKFFWKLDINNLDKGWETLPVWEGDPRTHAIGVVQNNGEEDCYYLLKGRFRIENGVSTMLKDGYYYIPSKKEWRKIAVDKYHPYVTTAAGTGLTTGANHILLLGGDDGRLFNRLEQFAVDIDQETDESKKLGLSNERDSILRNHPGFSRDVWAFHTITQAWTKVGELPKGSQVTTTALWWDDQIIIPTGEIAPCIRTDEILVGEIEIPTRFGKLNTAIVVAYLLLLVGMGFYFSKNQTSTEDFFKGGKRIPAWAAGISIFGTQLSAITFMAVPAKTFATDWLYFILSMTIIMVYPLIIKYFLPFYRRLNLTTAYEYLELRFNLSTRLVGSFMYMVLQLGRLGIVLLLPSLALSVVTGIDVSFCILAMGILSILYTVLGGIEAVIWTDVIQVFVLLGGALFALGILFSNLNQAETVAYIADFEKMKIFDFSFDFTNATLWVVLFGGLASNLIQYGSDQTVIQRYLTTKDEASAAKSIKIGAWMALPSTLIFFTLGTLLFVFYKTQPDLLNPALEKTDSIFPWFIINSLPTGVSGLLVAAIFAASMSSLDSSMNSVSTVITTDFFRRLKPLNSEASYLKLARSLTVIIGILGTGLALMMANWGISSLWDQFNMIVGLFSGGLGGIFILGIFFKRANGMGALIGLIASGGIQYLIKTFTDVHFLLYALTGMVAGILIGYIASLLIGKEKESAQNFTLSGLKNYSNKD